MKHRPIIAPILLLAGVVGLGGVHVSTGNAALPASAAHLPPAQRLITAAQRAVIAAGSVHIAMVITERAHGGALPGGMHGTIQGDVSTRTPVRARLVMQISLLRARVVIVGNTAAIRASTGASWQCESVAQLSQLGGLNLGSGLLSPARLRINHAKTVGLTTINGQPAWHVRGRLNTTSGGMVVRQNVNVFIARSNDRLLRLTSTGKTHSAGTTIQTTTVVNASRYGETLNVQLPKACRSHQS